jgi:hypothetical protein
MQAIAEMVQRNPSLVLVLLVGLPSLTWAAAYGRRPSPARRNVALAALAFTVIVAAAGAIEAARAGEPWWPPVAAAGAIGVVSALLLLRGR